MSVTPFRKHPDLGTPEVFRDPADPDGYRLNVAATVRIIAHEDTPQAKRLYAEFLKAWDRWKNRPFSDDYKQGEALKEAIAAVGADLPVRH